MGRAARLPYSLKVEVVKLPLTPRALVLEGPHLAILISATRMELQEGRSIGLEFPELPVRALIDTGASLTIINPEIATTCKLKQTGHQTINAVGGAAGEYPEDAAAISFPGRVIPRLDNAPAVSRPIMWPSF